MTAEEICNKILSEIPDGASGKMFGANAIKTPDGKAGAFFKNDRLIVKIHGNDLSEAEKLDAVKPFSPKEGNIMNGWVEIPFDHKEYWKKFAEISCAEVAKLEPNKTKKMSLMEEIHEMNALMKSLEQEVAEIERFNQKVEEITAIKNKLAEFYHEKWLDYYEEADKFNAGNLEILNQDSL